MLPESVHGNSLSGYLVASLLGFREVASSSLLLGTRHLLVVILMQIFQQFSTNSKDCDMVYYASSLGGYLFAPGEMDI